MEKPEATKKHPVFLVPIDVTSQTNDGQLSRLLNAANNGFAMPGSVLSMPGSYSAVYWGGPMVDGRRPPVQGVNPMMMQRNSVVAGTGHMMPRADVMMSGLPHNVLREKGNPTARPESKSEAKNRIAMEEAVKAAITTRKESYYEPYYKDGHWVFNRKTTLNASLTSSTKKSVVNANAVDLDVLKSDNRNPSTSYECDQICPEVFAKTGKVCGMVMESYWGKWWLLYRTFDNMCMLQLGNCNTEDRYTFVHMGGCPEDYFIKGGYHATDPADTWGIVSRAMFYQGQTGISPKTDQHYAQYTHWWYEWRRRGNFGNYSEKNKMAAGEDKMAAWDVTSQTDLTDTTSGEHSRRQMEGVTESMKSVATDTINENNTIQTT